MNGAESLVRTLVGGGIEVCFANPGTTELHIVSAIDRVSGLRGVLGLFEGVVTGAADGYARMAGKPAVTLMHMGPGFSNGLANLHNAKRARVPIVNIIGNHATYHQPLDAPLTADIEGLARPCSAWVRTASSALGLAHDAAEAIVAARSASGCIATLIVPVDTAWGTGAGLVPLPAIASPPLPTIATVESAAALLRSKLPTALIVSGNGLYGTGLANAGRIAGATGAQILAPFGFTRLERGAGRTIVDRVPFVLEQAIELLARFRQFILVGAPLPVAFFAYPGQPGILTPPESTVLTLARPGEDCAGALAMLVEALGLSQSAYGRGQEAVPISVPSGEITTTGLAPVVGAHLPEAAIVIDESLTSGRTLLAQTQGAKPHDWLVNTGGSIGIAMPLAVGASIACPGRPVLCLSGDGGGMYTLQALWTMVRESLPVTVVIFANRTYAVVKAEWAGVGAGAYGRTAEQLLEIGRPDLDWVSLAKGLGVPARRATSLEEFGTMLGKGLASGGPNLIEVPL
jgi:acetolactate synthase-1/2/3 large subunit